MRRVLFVLLLLSLASSVRADDLDDASRLLWSGHMQEGLAAIRALAEGGNLKAELLLGEINSQPNRVIEQPDPNEAMKWLSRASAQGAGRASAEIAELYERGFGVVKSSSEARIWWDLAAKQGWDQQELDLRCFSRVSGPKPLACEPINAQTTCPSDAEMESLRAAGLTGIITPTGGGGGRFRLGPKARALLILDHNLKSEVRLKQPRHTNVIYVQNENGWVLLPSGAPLIDRPIILKPQPDTPKWYSLLAGVQDVDGSVSSGGCAVFKPPSEQQPYPCEPQAIAKSPCKQ